MRWIVCAALALIVALAVGAQAASAAETIDHLVRRCTAAVSPRLAEAIIAVESGGQWWAVNDNDVARTPTFPSPAAAIEYAQSRVAQGASIDLGLAQLNSAHLSEYGLSVEQAFDPCTNVHVAMNVMLEAWEAASRRWGYSPYALYKAMEAYNGGTGSWSGSPATRARVAHYARRLWEVTSEFVALSRRATTPVVVVSRIASPHRVKIVFAGRPQ
jgi:type IV secretion system protein VirB1